jgi:DNA repair protein RecN (Recombination protein N)
MLLELRVTNLLLIESARLELAGGLNVLTGETGAGKTVLAHALDLLLGGRAKQGIVRPGASEAYVEGVFELPDDLFTDRLADDDDELILARRVGADGRTRAYLNGRTIPVGELRELATGLLSFYGQHEHRRLMLGGAQLEILDAFCGADQLERRRVCVRAWHELGEATAELERIAELAGARERELDLLEFELEEIEALDPQADERPELEAERERLRHVESLRAAAWGAEQALAAEDAGATEPLAAAGAALGGVGGVDWRLDTLAERVRALSLEARDLATELRGYGEQLDADPGRLELLEERLAAIARLERKHGGSVAGVLAHAERCRERRDELLGAEVALAAAEEQLSDARERHDKSVAALRSARTAAAAQLATAVAERLQSLAMEDAQFAISVRDADPGPSGADAVQFDIAPNRGVPAAPLRDIASGGELSRVMLALLGAANDRSQATLVFDEVDAGIGGHTARAVGEQLRELAEGRQIVCITHLPQVASIAARHFTIAKDATAEPARASVARLERQDVVAELVRMLGADADDAGARRHATALLRAA